MSRVQGAIPEVDVHIDHLDLKPDGNAVLRHHFSIQVDQTNQVVPI